MKWWVWCMKHHNNHFNHPTEPRLLGAVLTHFLGFKGFRLDFKELILSSLTSIKIKWLISWEKLWFNYRDKIPNPPYSPFEKGGDFSSLSLFRRRWIRLWRNGRGIGWGCQINPEYSGLWNGILWINLACAVKLYRVRIGESPIH